MPHRIGPLQRVEQAFSLYAPPVTCLALIYALSAQSHPLSAVPQIFWIPDWGLHALEFVVLGFLVIRSFSGGLGHFPKIFPAFSTGILCVGYGIFDEWHQSFVPGRQSTYQDALADAVGVVLGICLFMLVSMYWRKR